MKPELPIVYSIDDNYAQHCAASIASLLTNISDKYIAHIFVICESISDENACKLRETAKINSCKLSFIVADGNAFGGIQVPRPWSNSILHRLKIPTLLGSYPKAIYLDADTIVEADITELFDSADLDNYTLGAVSESELYGQVHSLMHSFRLMIPPTYGYFNSGVLLLNLTKMRETGFENACVDVIMTGKRHVFPDQDALNIAAHGDYLRLPSAWNLQVHTKYAARVARKCKRNAILHFSGPIKPWQLKRSIVCKYYPSIKINASARYYKYLDLTPWKGCELTTSYRPLIRHFIASLDVVSAAIDYISSKKLERKISKNVNGCTD
jgi:lipopolysaccharide biosynthesis glycosyltransferase